MPVSYWRVLPGYSGSITPPIYSFESRYMGERWVAAIQKRRSIDRERGSAEWKLRLNIGRGLGDYTTNDVVELVNRLGNTSVNG